MFGFNETPTKGVLACVACVLTQQHTRVWFDLVTKTKTSKGIFSSCLHLVFVSCIAFVFVGALNG